MTTVEISNWVGERLVSLLGLDSASIKDICGYMMSFTDIDELTTFTIELLCGSNDLNQLDGPQKDFLRELKVKWQKSLAPDNVTVYKKDDDLSKSKSNRKVAKSSKLKKNPFDLSSLDVPSGNTTSIKKEKKKANLVSLYGKHGQVRNNAVMLPGRNACECQGQKHKYVNCKYFIAWFNLNFSLH